MFTAVHRSISVDFTRFAGGDGGFDARADLNRDGRVDAADLGIVVRNQGK